jgi:hypothetical protein
MKLTHLRAIGTPKAKSLFYPKKAVKMPPDWAETPCHNSEKGW